MIPIEGVEFLEGLNVVALLFLFNAGTNERVYPFVVLEPENIRLHPPVIFEFAPVELETTTFHVAEKAPLYNPGYRTEVLFSPRPDNPAYRAGKAFLESLDGGMKVLLKKKASPSGSQDVAYLNSASGNFLAEGRGILPTKLLKPHQFAA